MCSVAHMAARTLASDELPTMEETMNDQLNRAIETYGITACGQCYAAAMKTQDRYFPRFKFRWVCPACKHKGKWNR